MADDLKYGYKGAEPTQSFGNNTGVFDPNDINNLIADNKWTTFGQLELIETQTASADSSVDFIDLATNSYNVYFVTLNNIQTSSASQNTLRFSNNNGSSFIASGYQYAFQRLTTAGSSFEAKSTSATQIYTEMLSDTSTGSSGNGYFYLYNLLDSSKYSFATFQFMSSWSDERMTFGSGVLPTAETHNAFQLLPSAGTISGTISLYGIRYS